MLKTISDLYKFYLYHPINGLIEVFPHNTTLEWSWEKNKEENQAFNRKKLNTELVFKKNDFFLFYNLERSNYKCEKLHLDIHRECNGIFSLFYTGYFALIDGDYDRDKCVVRIKLRQNDEYSCIFQQWTKEKDFIGGVGAPGAIDDIKFQQGEIQYESCVAGQFYEQNISNFLESYVPSTSCLSNPSMWTLIGVNAINVQVYFPDPQYSEYQFDVESIYAREVVNTTNIGGLPVPPSGFGWFFLVSNGFSSTWVRPLQGDFNALTKEPIKNGRKLKDVIQFLVQDCDLTVVSDFFDKNADNTHPTNFAYDYADEFYKDLVIWQKSDVKRQPRVITSGDNTITLPFENATKALIKLKELLKWLYDMYNVQWAIIGNTFRIEHYTYWNSSRQNIIDLTQNDRIKGNFNYKYLSEELPASEKWSWMEESDKSDFDGIPIIYPETCSYDEDDAKNEGYNISKITTNLEYIILNLSKISDDGFVIASTQNNVLQGDICRISNKSKINGPNAFSNLNYYLHRHGRPQRQGNMNGNDEAFYFPKPKRQGPDVSVRMCCNELVTFDTNFRVKTMMNWGNIVSAKLKEPNGIMTLSLLHE